MGLNSLKWDERFITGLPLVDDEHRGLVERINAFGASLQRRAAATPEEVGNLLDTLAAYAQRHFTDETRLQEEAGLDARFLEMHQLEHALFTAEVLNRRAVSIADPEAARGLLGFLIQWLSAHILGTDQLAARQIALVRSGATPAEAFARVGSAVASAHGLLPNAVDELLGLVATRNAELESLNASLESRVQARTRELEAANARLRQTQQQLVEAGKLASVGQLASGVAHELNSPLGAALSNLGAMGAALQDLFELIAAYRRAEADVGPDLRARLQQARATIDLDFLKGDLPSLIAESQADLRRAAMIVRGLKEFSRVDAAAALPTDLNRALESAISMVPPALRSVVPIEFMRGEVSLVQARGAAINHALLALLTNAAQAVRDRSSARLEPGAVTVRTGMAEGKVFAEVADNGDGVSAETRAHLFEPFFTTRPAGQGLGLGLSSAWGVAQREGGTITVESTPGAGSTFTLSLPIGGDERVDEGAPGAANAFNRRKVGEPRETPTLGRG